MFGNGSICASNENNVVANAMCVVETVTRFLEF